MSTTRIIEIRKNNITLAWIIKSDYHSEGINFITPGEYSQQVAYMHHPKGKKIAAHIHNVVHRSVVYTQEVLIIKKGKLRVDFYDIYQDYIESHILEEGDVILLASGGHGFEVLEEVEMIEVKQGPYAGDNDKIHFDGINEENIIINESFVH